MLGEDVNRVRRCRWLVWLLPAHWTISWWRMVSRYKKTDRTLINIGWQGSEPHEDTYCPMIPFSDTDLLKIFSSSSATRGFQLDTLDILVWTYDTDCLDCRQWWLNVHLFAIRLEWQIGCIGKFLSLFVCPLWGRDKQLRSVFPY